MAGGQVPALRSRLSQIFSILGNSSEWIFCFDYPYYIMTTPPPPKKMNVLGLKRVWSKPNWLTTETETTSKFNNSLLGNSSEKNLRFDCGDYIRTTTQKKRLIVHACIMSDSQLSLESKTGPSGTVGGGAPHRINIYWEEGHQSYFLNWENNWGGEKT